MTGTYLRGQVTKVFSSPLQRAMYTSKVVQTFQTLAGHKPPQALQREELTNRDWGEWDGQLASEVASARLLDVSWVLCGGQSLHEARWLL